MKEFYDILNGRLLTTDKFLGNTKLSSGKIILSDGSIIDYLGNTNIISIQGQETKISYNPDSSVYTLTSDASIERVHYIPLGGASSVLSSGSSGTSKSCISFEGIDGGRRYFKNNLHGTYASFSGNLVVSGDTTVSNLTIAGDSELKNILTINNSASGSVTLNTLNVTGNVECKNSVTINAKIELGSENTGFGIRDYSSGSTNWNDPDIGTKVALYNTADFNVNDDNGESNNNKGIKIENCVGKGTVISDDVINDYFSRSNPGETVLPGVGILDGLHIDNSASVINEVKSRNLIVAGKATVNNITFSDIDKSGQSKILLFGSNASGNNPSKPALTINNGNLSLVSKDSNDDKAYHDLWYTGDTQINLTEIKVPSEISESVTAGATEYSDSSSLTAITVSKPNSPTAPVGGDGSGVMTLTGTGDSGLLTLNDNSYNFYNVSSSGTVTENKQFQIFTKSVKNISNGTISELAESSSTNSPGSVLTIFSNNNNIGAADGSITVSKATLKSDKWAKDTMFAGGFIGTYNYPSGESKDCLRYNSYTKKYTVDLDKVKEYDVVSGTTYFMFAEAGTNTSQQFELIESDSGGCDIKYENNICKITVNGEFIEYVGPSQLSVPIVTSNITTSGTIFTIKNSNSGSGNTLMYSVNGVEKTGSTVSGNEQTTTLTLSTPGDSVQFWFKGDGINTSDSNKTSAYTVKKQLIAPTGIYTSTGNGYAKVTVTNTNAVSVSASLYSSSGTKIGSSWSVTAGNAAASGEVTELYQNAYVKFTSSNSNYTESEKSSAINIVPRLKTPTLTAGTTGEYSTSYTITNNDNKSVKFVDASTGSIISGYISSGSKYTGSVYQNTSLRVYAYKDGYESSDSTNSVTINVKLKKPVLTVSDNKNGSCNVKIENTNYYSVNVTVIIKDSSGTTRSTSSDIVINAQSNKSTTISSYSGGTVNVYFSNSTHNTSDTVSSTIAYTYKNPTVSISDAGSGSSSLSVKITNPNVSAVTYTVSAGSSTLDYAATVNPGNTKTFTYNKKKAMFDTGIKVSSGSNLVNTTLSSGSITLPAPSISGNVRRKPSSSGAPRPLAVGGGIVGDGDIGIGGGTSNTNIYYFDVKNPFDAAVSVVISCSYTLNSITYNFNVIESIPKSATTTVSKDNSDTFGTVTCNTTITYSTSDGRTFTGTSGSVSKSVLVVSS